MCKGSRGEDSSPATPVQREIAANLCSGHAPPHHRVSCELCHISASFYCQADNAFLCRKCDKWVHGANFLAQRHLRCVLCSTCQGLTNRYLAGSSLETVVNWGDNDCINPSTIKTRCTRRASKRPFLFL